MMLLIFRVSGQQMLSAWNFNSALPTDNNKFTGVTTPLMGSGITFLTGGATQYSISPFDEGSDNDQFSTGRDNSGWNISSFPAQRTGSRTAGIVFACNTTGYQNIVFRFDEKHSSSSANTTVVQYNPDTLNAAGWVTVQTNKISDSTLENEWFTRVVDLSTVTDVNNKERFAIRVVAAFDPQGDTVYVSTGSQNAATYSASGGTIRFDMVSLRGFPSVGFEVTQPTLQASDPSVIQTTDSTIRFSFMRGNGDSVMVICREDYAVNNYPLFPFNYSANNRYGFGEQTGAGNFVIYKSNKPGKNTITVRGLSAAKKYHFAILEFSAERLYMIDPVYFHATAGGTLLEPGDLLLTGFDTRVPGFAAGNDKHYITTLATIRPGTFFNLTSSRYEAGAPPNVKTRRWYNSGDNIYEDMDVLEFFWTGTTDIPAGSVIAVQDKLTSSGAYDSVTLNGVFMPEFISDLKKGGFNVATRTTKGEQFFITQGSYYPVGDIFTDRYNLLFGRVLFGMTLNTDWVALSASPGTASSGISYRSSRIPDDISCMQIRNLSDTVGVGYYSGITTGNKRALRLAVNDNTNWKWKRGDSTFNLTESYIAPFTGEAGTPFTIQASTNTDGTWLGTVSTDWFNCANWEGNFVPGSSTPVRIPTGAPFYPALNSTAPCRSVNVNTGASLRTNSGGNLEVLGE